VAVLYGLHLVSGVQPDPWAAWWHELQVKLPLLLIPCACLLDPAPITRTDFRIGLAVFVLGCCWVGGATALHYRGHQAEILELMAASKPMPLAGATRNLSHIYFSVYLAFGILALWLEQGYHAGWVRVGLWLVSAMLLALLFFIGARTGLMALATGGGVWALLKLRARHRWWWWPAIGLGGLISTVAAWQFLPSFQQRMLNTWADLSAFRAGTTVPHTWSLTARLHAWQTAGEAIRERPLTGYGIQNVHWRLWAGYHQSPLWHSLGRTPIYVHNQFLEWAIAFGVVGVAVWVYVLLAAPRAPCAWILTGVLMGGCLSESLLERQLGLGFWLLFLVLTQASVPQPPRAEGQAS
jgi:O-antigen ligase